MTYSSKETMEFLLPPILSADQHAKIQTAKKLGLQIVLVTGVFDLLHEEHIRFLLC